MSTRAKVGFGAALEDLGGFAPAPRAQPRPKTAALPPETAEAMGFPSREATATPPTASEAPRPQQQRRHRTGRSAQINIKATPETIAAFQAWADRQGLSIAEAFELATKKLSSS